MQLEKEPWIAYKKVLTLSRNQCRINYWSEKQPDRTAFQGDYSSRGCEMRWPQKAAENCETDWGGFAWWVENDWHSVVAMPVELSRRITEPVSRNSQNNTWHFIYLMQIYYYESVYMPGNDIFTCIHLFYLTHTKKRQNLQNDWDFDVKCLTHQ